MTQRASEGARRKLCRCLRGQIAERTGSAKALEAGSRLDAGGTVRSPAPARERVKIRKESGRK